MSKEIPAASLERFPLYHRTLEQLEERGFETISSHQLAGFLNITSEMLRRDLSFCGNFGVKSIGYYVADLKNEIGKFLGLDYKKNVGIVGAGALGIALATNGRFAELGFNIVAIFDTDKDLIGTEIGDVKIYDFEKLPATARRKMIDIGIIAVDKNFAQTAADALVEGGVVGIWNFAPVKLFAPPNVSLRDTDLSFDLSVLNFHVRRTIHATQKIS